MNIQESVPRPLRSNPGKIPKSRDERAQGVRVTALGGGVVRLATKGASLQEQLRAIENEWGVAGVASEA